MTTATGTQPKVNMMEQVSEARVARVVAEETALATKNEEIRLLQIQTEALLSSMEAAREDGNEEVRRRYRNEAVVLNMRLVTVVLQKYGSFSQDKFQNGCVGLLKAAETFNSDRGVPFKNYACFCIETEVRLAYKTSNRKFEGKNAKFLDSIDAPATTSDGDEIDKHNMLSDEYAEMAFDQILEEAEVDTIFYDIIVPCIEEYRSPATGVDPLKWRELTLQYFLELSMEHSRVQRLTFTEMAAQLGTTVQNIRTRNSKLMKLIRSRCEQYGYYLDTAFGRARIVSPADISGRTPHDSDLVKWAKANSRK